MKALIFGVNGQDGYYLTELLNLRNIDILGVSRSAGDWIVGDVADYYFVETLIKKHQPDYVFHFAANSTTHHDALFDNYKAISIGTLNILESIRLNCPKARVFLSGSAMQFENKGFPIDEQTPFEAGSHYSLARIHSAYAGRYYRDKFGLKVYIGYFFNHDSPRRSDKHINQKIVSTINRIANGSVEKLELGNLDVKKEFNYAGDMVSAIWILINQESLFEAVIGCGTAHSIKDWTEYCFNKINKNWKDFVILKGNYIPEYKTLVSNPRKIKSLVWEPKVDFYQLADMMMDIHL